MDEDQEQQGCTASWPDAEHQVRKRLQMSVANREAFIKANNLTNYSKQTSFC